MHGWKLRVLALVGALVALPLVGCGDDGGGDVAEYCELSTESESADPTDEDVLNDLEDAAPDEIADEVETAVDEIRNNSDEVFAGESDEFNEAVEAIEEFEAENCDTESS